MAKPTWPNLPLPFLREVVAHLDFKSRIRFSITSKLHYELVRTVPLSFYELVIYLPTKKFPMYCIETEDDKKCKAVFLYFKDVDTAVSVFLNWFRNKKSKIENLQISYEPEDDSSEEPIVDPVENLAVILNSEMESRGIEKIKVSHLSFLFKHPICTSCSKILTCFDPDFLKRLDINPGLTDKTFESFQETEIWKNLDNLRLTGNCEIPILTLLPPKATKLHVENNNSTVLTPKDVRELVQIFISRNAASFLVLVNQDHFDMNAVVEELRRDSYEVTSKSVYTDLKFKTDSSKLYFDVKIFNGGVQGGMCDVDGPEMRFYFKLCLPWGEEDD